MRPLVTVAGTALPVPSTYEGNTATLVDGARNVQGSFIGSVICDDKAKIDITWRFLTVEQWAGVNALFDRVVGGSFINPVTFFDQARGGFATREMYVSDRGAPLWRCDPDTGEVMGWANCRLALIEV